LWKTDQYPANPRHIGEHIKKRRFDLKMPAFECQKILGVAKETLSNWERGKHEPGKEVRRRIIRFLGYDPP
jgi:DNA-binding transcriptional regulator YiaG